MTDSIPKTNRAVQELRVAGKLPSPHGVALAIMELAQDECAAVDDFVRLIRTDPALSGRMIHAANAVNRSARRPAAALSDAVAILGVTAVRQLALGFSLVSRYRGGSCAGFDYDRFWTGSLLAAIVAPAFAAHTRIAAAEELFICGLLARIGRLGLATAHPAGYAAVLDAHRAEPATGLAVREAAAFGITGLELTAEMLGAWGIPRYLTDSLRHHEESRCSHFAEGSRGAMLRNVIRLAVLFADMCAASAADQRRLLSQIIMLAAQAGIDADAVVAIGDGALRELRDWSSLLGVRDSGTGPFAALAAEPSASPEAAGGGRLRMLTIDGGQSLAQEIRDEIGRVYEVHDADSAGSGLARALELEPHIVLLDWDDARASGSPVCRTLRESAIGRGMYLMVLTADAGPDCAVAAFDTGADDVILKPVHRQVLLARLRVAERVHGLRAELEHDRGELRRFSSELVIANRRLQENALHDVVTGLPNRGQTVDCLQREWLAAMRGGYPLSCVLIEIRRLRELNDAHGQDAVDAILREASVRLRASCRAQDVLGRVSGARFMMICPEFMPGTATEAVERIRAAMAEGFPVNRGPSVMLAIGSGIASTGGAARTAADLFVAAEQALRAAEVHTGSAVKIVPARGRDAAA